MIKKTVLLVALVMAALTFGTTLQAQGIRVEIGDRTFYTHGPRFWDGDWEMIWVPGHWDHHHHWVHGYYRRGEHRHHRERHHHHHRDNDRGTDFHAKER